MQHSKAIVTLAIGQRYLKFWQRFCKANWQSYADKHGYDIICIDNFLDNSERAKQRSPAWQKCLILSQDFARRYERIVWIDADILINASNAPCIVEGVPKDKVGAVKTRGLLSPELDDKLKVRFQDYYNKSTSLYYDPREFYTSYGLPADFDEVINTGVLVLSPHSHQKLLEKVYGDYEEKGAPEWNAENRPLSYELLKTDSVYWLDPRFNILWSDYRLMYYPFLLSKSELDSTSSPIFLDRPEILSALGVASSYRYSKLCATTAFINSFFLHFAGCPPDIALVDSGVTSWRDCTEERIAATINNELAQIYAEQGQTEQSILLYQQSLESQEAIRDIRGKAATLQHLADLCAREGKINSAIALYQQSLDVQKHINQVREQAATLVMTGQLLAVQGDFATALRYLQESLEILGQLKSSDVEAVREIITEVEQMAKA